MVLQGQRPQHRAGHQAWPSLPACPQPEFPVGEAAGPGGVSCPPKGTKAVKGGQQRAASPHPEEPTAPEGAQLADCTTATFGSGAHTALFSRNPKEAQAFPQPSLGAKEGPRWKPGALMSGAPHTPWGFLRQGPSPDAPLWLSTPHCTSHTQGHKYTHGHTHRNIHTCAYICTGGKGTHGHTHTHI